MKKITLGACLLAALTFATACGGGNKDDNKSDSSSQTSVSATTDNTKDNTATKSSDTSSSAASATASKDADQQFMMEAANGGMMEVDLGNVAESNAASPKVKAFGKMMVTDHTKANNELKALAAKKNVTLPASPDEEHQGHINDMKGKKGADFDKAYVDMMVSDHETDVKKFEDESSNGKDADVKAFATKTLPVLKKHLTSIKEIQGSMKQ